MENLLLTVNIVFPIFLVMAVGYFCRHSGTLNAEDIVAMNRVSFGVFLPASLCHSLLEVEAGAAVSPGVLAFGFAGTLVVFLLAFLIVRALSATTRAGASSSRASSAANATPSSAFRSRSSCFRRATAAWRR